MDIKWRGCWQPYHIEIKADMFDTFLCEPFSMFVYKQTLCKNVTKIQTFSRTV